MRVLRRWWRAARTNLGVDPVGHDVCETCHTPLRPSRVHEVTDVIDDFDDPEIAGPGGSSVSATYCPRCCPGGCTHPHHKERIHAS